LSGHVRSTAETASALHPVEFLAVEYSAIVTRYAATHSWLLV